MEIVKKKTDINAKVFNFSCNIENNNIVISFDNSWIGIIIALKIWYKGYNLFDDEIKGEHDLFTDVFQNLNIYPGESKRLVKSISNNDIKKITVKNLQIVYNDGSMHEGMSPKLVEYEIEELKSVEKDENGISEVDELSELKRINPNSICYPCEMSEGWLCSCATLNSNNNQRCLNCGYEKNDLVECERKIIRNKILKEKQRQDEINKIIEQQRIENEKKLAEKKKRDEEYKIALEEAKQLSEIERKKETKRNVIIASIVALIVVCISVFSIKNTIHKYNKGELIKYSVNENSLENRIDSISFTYSGNYVNEYEYGKYQTIVIDYHGVVRRWFDSKNETEGKIVDIVRDAYVVQYNEGYMIPKVKEYLFFYTDKSGEKYIKVSDSEKSIDGNAFYYHNGKLKDERHATLEAISKNTTEESTHNTSTKKSSYKHVCEVSSCTKEGTKEVMGIAGNTEYYCIEHYNEIQNMIGNMEKDVGSGSASKHQCEVSSCTKEGTHSIAGLNGNLEYYCSEHYQEIEDMLKIMLDDK